MRKTIAVRLTVAATSLMAVLLAGAAGFSAK